MYGSATIYAYFGHSTGLICLNINPGFNIFTLLYLKRQLLYAPRIFIILNGLFVYGP